MNRRNVDDRNDIQKKAILVGLSSYGNKTDEYSMQELKNLAGACDMEVVAIMEQNLPSPIAATYIGAGKAYEVAEMARNLEADYCIFEDTLSPAQMKNLQKIIEVPIMDRTGLILEIFSARAKSREAKLQVETAKLQYMLPRLIGMWEAIGRQGGASGSKSSKGIGETQLELDRRWIQKRLNFLKRELDAIEHDREVQRSRREKSALPLVALVGYTNSGKSTIMNRLLKMSGSMEDKQVFEEDMLFATLDTSVRMIKTGDKKDFLLSDTVGFVDKLPHSLIKAFRSTLDEIKYASLLVEVVDYSDERHTEQMKITQDTLLEIGVENIPIIHVMNKIDKCEYNGPVKDEYNRKVFISAREGKSVDILIDMIKDIIYDDCEVCEYLIPYSEGKLLNDLNEKSHVLMREYREDGVYIKAEVALSLRRMCEKILWDGAKNE